MGRFWGAVTVLTHGRVCQLESVQIGLQRNMVCTKLGEHADIASGESVRELAIFA